MTPTVPERDEEHGSAGGQGGDEGQAPGGQPDPGQQCGENRQVDGHGQVFEHEDAEDDRSLAVADPPQVTEYLGDDAGGGDPGDPGEGDGRDRSPAEQECRCGPGQRVEDEVDGAGRVLRLQVGDQVGCGVLQAQHEQQQDDADLGAGRDELLARAQWQQAAVAEGQPRQQVEGNWGLPVPAGDAAKQAQGEDDGAEFGERRGAHRSLLHEDHAGGVRAFTGADDNQGVAARQPEVRPGRWDGVGAAEHGDDR